MTHRTTTLVLLTVTVTLGTSRLFAQDASNPRNETTYRFTSMVDEVGVTFHASDINGLPVNDLKLSELSLLDNGKPPRRIVSFEVEKDSPIRAGVLIDTSKSMEGHLSAVRSISTKYAQRVLRQSTDQAFVLEFGYISRLSQSWTGNPTALSTAIGNAKAGRSNPLGGTALFDAIFRACFSEFGSESGKIDQTKSGNFILLFSDGEDNASHVSLKAAVDICQRANTAIYAFRADSELSSSTGPETLAELTEQTGGRVFHDDDSEVEIDQDLRAIETSLRNQYRLYYAPQSLQHDGSFHRIELHTPDRVNSLVVRTGYYAPTSPSINSQMP